jgi:uncharacterized cupredoxin-like copper-binding protein
MVGAGFPIRAAAITAPGSYDTHADQLQRRAKGAKALHVDVVRPKEHAEVEARLRPGRYDLWCSIPGHRERRMHAVLTVRR